MDDEDSKARRNFMTVSTIIVLAWWLQAPLDKLGEKLMNMPVGPGFEWRAWFAALLALVYFWLRFRFSKEHSLAVEALQRELSGAMRGFFSRWLRMEAASYAKRGRLAPVLKRSMLNYEAARVMMVPTDDYPSRSVSLERVTYGAQDENGQLIEPGGLEVVGIASLVLSRHDGRRGDSLIQKVRSELTPFERRSLAALMFAWLLVYSKASTSLLVPWIMGLCAGIICVLQALAVL